MYIYIRYTTYNSNYIHKIINKINSNYFQIISPNYLNSINYNNYDEISEFFEIDKIINKQNQSNCISVSLFCADSNNTYPDQYPSPSIEYGSKWYNKYMQKFIDIINNFNNSTYKDSWKIRVYLEPKLLELLSSINKDNVEIYVMKKNTIGANPGALWRFLAFYDKSIECVFCSDIDEDFINIKRWLNIINDCNIKYKDKVLIRTSTFSKDNSYLIGDRLDAYNIVVILGSMIGFYPRRSSLDIKNLLIKYTCLRINRLKLSNSHLDYDDDIPHTNFNRPLTPNNVGWGGNPFKYGFDEKFLKAVLFPYFVQRGELITITRDKDERREIMNSDNSEVKTYFKTELMFCDYYNNLLAYYE